MDQKIGLADDRENSDAANVLDFWQACDRAKALARGQDADAGRPATVDEALNDYATDLSVRGAHPTNATRSRSLAAVIVGEAVSLLTIRELRHWRNGLTKAMKASSVNRLTKALKACLSLCIAHDDQSVTATLGESG